VDPLYQELGRRLREAREAAQLTQAGLAARVALSRTSITNIEQGRQRLTVDSLVRLAAVVGVDPRQLLPSDGAADRTIPAHKLQGLAPGDRAVVERVMRHARPDHSRRET
jgi:transcriptional regulator with XRE-family HTH domain